MFSSVNSEDIIHFKSILGEKYVIEDEDKLDDANTDWMRKYKGSSKLMLQPRTTEEVCVLMFFEKYIDTHLQCNAVNIPLFVKCNFLE